MCVLVLVSILVGIFNLFFYSTEQSRTMREFDSKFTAPMFGLKSAEDYYTQGSPGNKIDRVSIPVLCLNAADDPFVPFDSELMAPNFRNMVTVTIY